jgi:hypothetical protein
MLVVPGVSRFTAGNRGQNVPQPGVVVFTRAWAAALSPVIGSRLRMSCTEGHIVLPLAELSVLRYGKGFI